LRPAPEPLAPHIRWLHDFGTLALLAVIMVPFYLLLNQYWQSVLQLFVGYGLLGIGFFRLGQYVRRVMRRTPAEIPPWYGTASHPSSLLHADMQFGTAEAIQNVYKDPYYLQDVMKPRLGQLLAYRVSGVPEASLATLTSLQAARLDPVILDFLQCHNATSLWAKYRYRRQRLQDVLAILRRLEAL
jgi:hypothetical protein